MHMKDEATVLKKINKILREGSNKLQVCDGSLLYSLLSIFLIVQKLRERAMSILKSIFLGRHRFRFDVDKTTREWCSHSK